MSSKQHARPATLTQALFGLLSMFGVNQKGELPKLVHRKVPKPPSVITYLEERASAKRLRKGNKPGASSYSKANLINA